MKDSATPYTIPALERFLKDARPWGLVERHPQGAWGGKAFDRQRTDPDPRGLLAKVGLKSAEQVLVVAGHRATWALALAKAGAKVTYSDVSRDLTRFVERSVTHRNIQGYLCTSYVLHPDLPNQYDWTFTFEAVGPKLFVLLLSLLNRRGGKYVIWEKGDHARRKMADLAVAVSLCKKLYRVGGQMETAQILCVDRTGKRKPRPHSIATVRASEAAREKVHLDLRIFQFLFKRKTIAGDHLCEIMGCSRQDLKRSLSRLSRWCGVFKDKYARTIGVRCLDGAVIGVADERNSAPRRFGLRAGAPRSEGSA